MINVDKWPGSEAGPLFLTALKRGHLQHHPSPTPTAGDASTGRGRGGGGDLHKRVNEAVIHACWEKGKHPHESKHAASITMRYEKS